METTVATVLNIFEVSKVFWKHNMVQTPIVVFVVDFSSCIIFTMLVFRKKCKKYWLTCNLLLMRMLETDIAIFVSLVHSYPCHLLMIFKFLWFTNDFWCSNTGCWISIAFTSTAFGTEINGCRTSCEYEIIVSICTYRFLLFRALFFGFSDLSCAFLFAIS